MEIFDKIEAIPNLSLALGFFDGVHLGHKEVIKNANAVVTFKNSPAEMFLKEPVLYITSLEKRRELIASLGIDYLFELEFTPELAQMTGEEYLRDILIKNFSPKTIVTGFNHTFGREKSGNAQLLSECQTKYGYEYIKIPEQTVDGVVVSSSQIKEYLQQGKIEQANKMLGRDFSLKGVVIKGKQLGRTIGFPTANIQYPDKIVEIPYGVYKTEDSITNYKDNLLETHILDFDADIYGQEFEIKFKKYLRAEKKFDSVYDLKKQITKDIEECSK